jgi:hypothetical protein
MFTRLSRCAEFGETLGEGVLGVFIIGVDFKSGRSEWFGPTIARVRTKPVVIIPYETGRKADGNEEREKEAAGRIGRAGKAGKVGV